MRARTALSVLFVGAVLATFSCEVLVPGDLPSSHCNGTPGSCPDGQFCMNRECTPCLEPGNDPCNQLDDDCNGKVDDGPLSDRDNDGFSYCGRVDQDAGKVLDQDCDDNNASIFPGAPEVCDGKDNDCNGIVDDPGVVCPQGETCAPKTGECISTTQTCQQVPCTSPQVCDPDTLKCVDPTASHGLGDPCNGDRECTSGFCAYSNVVGAKIAPTGGVCTKSCCSSAECAGNNTLVCYPSGTGGKYCVKASAAGVTTGSTPAGTSAAAASDCRSGQLDGTGHCTDVCCSDVQCGGMACAGGQLYGVATYVCRDPQSGSGNNSSCNNSSDCSSNACLNGTCRSNCCNSAPCGNALYGQRYCTLYYGANADFQGCTDPFPAEFGGSAVGSSCSQDTDCRGRRCVTDNNGSYCTDACCTDGDCPNGFPCRPVDVGQGVFALECTRAQ